jgi:hypothetical protein
MKTYRLSVINAAFLVLTMSAACEVAPSTEHQPDDLTSTPEVDSPSAVPSVVETNPTSPASTELPGNVYLNQEYQFTFEIPEGWFLEELTWVEMEGEDPHRAIVLSKDFYEIIFEYKTVFEERWIGPRGMPAGDRLVKLDEIPILGQLTSGHLLVYQDKDKILSFGIRSEELRASILLRQIEGPDMGYSYEDTELPEDIQADLTALVQSLSRTGTYQLPESIAMLAEFPVILPMEKSYYSQIYDTKVANACGPAAAMMVLDFYGVEDSLQRVIEKLQSMPGPGAFDPGCYINTVCTSPTALVVLLYDYGLDVRSHENWTLPEVFAVVSRGYPIIVDILWDTATDSLGHFVVIYGVDIDQELIYYHDPYRGSEMTASWDDFASLWEGRVDIGDPVWPEGHRFWGLEVRPTRGGRSTG